MDKRNTSRKQSFDIPALVGELESLDVTRRERARRTLAALGSTALPCLTEALQHPAEWVRWEAATTLGMIASSDSASALTAVLEDPSPAVRQAAAESLAEIGNPACPVVIDALNKRYESETVRQGAHRVLQILALRGKLSRIENEVYTGLHGLLSEQETRDLTGQAATAA